MQVVRGRWSRIEDHEEQPGRGSTTTPEAQSQWGFSAVPATPGGTRLRCFTRKGAVQGEFGPNSSDWMYEVLGEGAWP